MRYTINMNIYFSGIGGVGIGPLAELAFDAGYDIQGSDQQTSAQVESLLGRGVAVQFDQTGSFLRRCHQSQPIDWFVYTAALPDDHPELVIARQLGIKTAKRDELLVAILRDKQLKLIAISGTHGKTTTTGMMIWTLQNLGIPISYSVGSSISFGPSGKYDPASEYFIYECDEFDRNFLHFDPYLSLITVIDYDHSDTYPSQADYNQAFQDFITKSAQTIGWARGMSAVADLPYSTWALQDDESVDIALAGAHNRRNATLVLKAIEYLGQESELFAGKQEASAQILADFPGTSRRFEKLGQNLFSDYGHHPTEIKATLQLASEVSDNITLVYQPHQNVRQHEIVDQYTDCFELASYIYWLPTYLTRENPDLDVLAPQRLTSQMTNLDHVRFVELDNNLWDIITTARKRGSLVLLMGAGTIDNWARQKLAEEIKA